MRMSSVEDCLKVLSYYGIDPSQGAAVDVGGTETVSLKSRRGVQTLARNPLLRCHPDLIFLDEGFNQERFGGRADEYLDFLDESRIAHLQNRFDLVFCFDTLEHIRDPFRFCAHLARIAKPAGYIYLATVFRYAYHPSPEDYFRFSPAGLRECFLAGVGEEAKAEAVWCDWESDEDAVAILVRKGAPPPALPAYRLPRPPQPRRTWRGLVGGALRRVQSLWSPAR